MPRTLTNWDELIDLERRTVSPRVFTDPDVYRMDRSELAQLRYEFEDLLFV